MGFKHLARLKGHHSSGRNRDRFTRSRIPSQAGTLISDGELTKTGDHDRFAILEAGLNKLQNPIEQSGCF